MTVRIKQIQEIIDPEARWIAKDRTGDICWSDCEPEWFGNRRYLVGDKGGWLGQVKVAEFEGEGLERLLC